MTELDKTMFARTAQDLSGDPSDRRREPRSRRPRPVYLQPAEPDEPKFEEVRTMTNFSRSGFFFITHRESYRKGMQLHVIPAFGPFNFEYVAQVVRIEELPFGEYGVAVHLLHMRDSLANSSTVTKSAFQSFALAEQPSAAMDPRDKS